ncbi:hypothetical protein GOBAR_DD32844 [Gossypium barbadense]|nr:hypothetical protein GOBAR_DD32844 [Gossypium barbadense]
MEKQMIFAWAMIFCLAMAPVYGQYYSRTVKAGPRVEKITHLHFYFHDIRSGKFELTSTLVGNAQGLYLALSRDLTKFSAVFYADFTFTTGRFNGSSFSLFSRFPPTDVVPAPGTIREMAIVGGTGKFRMATGFALLRPTSSSNTVGDANVEFNVTLYHY